jgi:hypothetical protein
MPGLDSLGNIHQAKQKEATSMNMNANKTIKSIMEFNKNVFDNTFNALESIGDQNEKMFHSLMDQALMPEERKSAIIEYVGLYRRGWQEFKKAVDENYSTVVKPFDDDKAI